MGHTVYVLGSASKQLNLFSPNNIYFGLLVLPEFVMNMDGEFYKADLGAFDENLTNTFQKRINFELRENLNFHLIMFGLE